jgi:hypothetical protein
MRLFEITKMKSFSMDIGQFGDYTNISKNAKIGKLSANSNLLYAIEYDSGEIEISIFENQGPILGVIKLEPEDDFPLKNTHTVDFIGVDPQYRGSGIAKSLYGVYFTKIRFPLVSGMVQTPGGRRNWVSLANIPGVKLKGWISISDSLFDNKSPSMFTWKGMNKNSIDKILDRLMASGAEYIGKKGDDHFFSFETVPGTAEMQPITKKALDAYGKYGIGYRTGLYAIWTGK